MRKTRRNYHPSDHSDTELVQAIMVNRARQTVRVGPIWSALPGEIVSYRRPAGPTITANLEKIARKLRAAFRGGCA